MRLVPIGAVLAHHTTLHLRLFRSVSMSARVPAINERRPSPWLLWVRAGLRFKSRRGTSPSMPSPMAKPSRELSSSNVFSTTGIVACLNGKTTDPSQHVALQSLPAARLCYQSLPYYVGTGAQALRPG